MKIGIITDTHIGFYENKINEFKQFIENLRVDILIISGDIIGSRQSEFELAFKTIRDADPFLIVLVVRGNHDFWTQDKPFATLPEIEEYHQSIFKKYKIHYLQNNKYEDDKIVVYGFDGWYRFQDTGTKDREMMPSNSGMGELDSFRALQRAEGQAVDYIIDDLEKNPTDKVKICVTHFSLVMDNPVYEKMTGNIRLLDILSPSFDYIIYGHSHRYYNQMHGNCRVINVGADYEQSPRNDLFFEEIVIK